MKKYEGEYVNYENEWPEDLYHDFAFFFEAQ